MTTAPPTPSSSNSATAATSDPGAPAALDDDDFAALQDILEDVRTRHADAPDWEFCDGFLAALVCTRRLVGPDEALAALLGAGAVPPQDDAPLVSPEAHAGTTEPLFSGPIQQRRFLALWQRRWAETSAALAADVAALDDPRAYAPAAIDVHGALAADALDALDEAGAEGDAGSAGDGSRHPAPAHGADDAGDRAGDAEGTADGEPAFAQLWAAGFLAAVEHWAAEWAAPRDPEIAGYLGEALADIARLDAPDRGPLTVHLSGDDLPAGASEARMDDYAAAIWAVYDLFRIWKSLGPATAPVRAAARPGRNDPCPCGSGKKYKKCCGA